MIIHTTRLILACLLCVSAFSGQAATLQLTAEYKPSISSPSHVSFTNTTPLSGYCQQHPTYCPEGVASIVIPGLEATKQFTNVTEDIRKHIYVKLDSRPKNIVLTNRITGQAIEVNFRLSVVAMQLAGDVSGYILNAGRLPEGGCQAGIETGSDTAYNFAWTFPANVQECYRRLKEDVHVDRVLSLSGISVGYEMSVDSPAGVYNGVYEGELVYSVGDNGDIDFGADTYSDSVLKIQIQAKVEHAFHLQFPPGSERLVLAPEGGWAKWLNSGQQPTRLGRDLDFFLTTTGPISVELVCEHIVMILRQCGLRNGEDVVPVETRLTLPGLNRMGAEVKESLLSVRSPARFDVKDFVLSKRSTLHMWVERSGVETMFRQPGSTWRGRVTLLFDAEL